MTKNVKKSKKNNPKIKKEPRVNKVPINSARSKPVWLFGLIDLEGEWGWKNVKKDCLLLEILPKIKQFEGMYWSEILGGKSHYIDISRILRTARTRLKELQIEDIDSLVSLRLSSTERLWGLKINNIFKI